MGIFKIFIIFIFIWEVFFNLFYYIRWNSNFYFLVKFFVNLVSVLFISNIFVCVDREKKI